MSLFNIGSSAMGPSPTARKKYTSPAFVSQHPDVSEQYRTTIRLNDKTFSLPHNVTSRATFQRSKLGIALDPNHLARQEFANGIVIIRTGPGELQVELKNESKDAETSEEDFALMIDALLGRKPLELFDFSNIGLYYCRLLGELEVWGFSRSVADIPFRLWTCLRWSDLTGMYALSRKEVEILRMEPVAIQLDDGAVQGVRLLSRVDLSSTLSGSWSTDFIKNLQCSGQMKRISALFEHNEYKVVLVNGAAALDTSRQGGSAANQPNIFQTDSDLVEAGQTTNVVSTIPLTTSPITSKPPERGNNVSQILMKLPHSKKVVAYDFLRNECLKAPSGIDFPLFYRRADRHVFVFSPVFALEVQEFTDAVSGLTKIRCGPSRVGQEIKMPQLGSGVNTSSQQTAAASVMNLFKSAATYSPTVKREGWQCSHPLFSSRCSMSMKHVKEFGDVHLVRFYPWGTLLTLAKAESPFAMLIIDHPKLKRQYGERILVFIRGLQYSGIHREDIDVAVTPGLERVYLCCCSQIASTTIIPNTPRVDFEVQELTNKKYRLKLVHIDIPDGAPSGQSLGSLNCLGLLSEFNTKTGIYYQSAHCRQMCSRYTVVSSDPGLPAAREPTYSTAAESEVEQLESSASENEW